jgi:ABC-type multidrug transport system fused ATPase/permease subunit
MLAAITPGTFVSFIGAMLSLMNPLKSLTNINEKLQRGISAATEIFRLLAEEQEHTGVIDDDESQYLPVQEAVTRFYFRHARLAQRLALYLRVGKRSLRALRLALPLMAPVPQVVLDGTRRLQLVHALSFAPRKLLGHLDALTLAIREALLSVRQRRLHLRLRHPVRIRMEPILPAGGHGVIELVTLLRKHRLLLHLEVFQPVLSLLLLLQCEAFGGLGGLRA